MNLSTDRDDLLAGLQLASRAASTRSAVQALSGIHVSATSGGLELRATDLDMSLRVPVAGQAETEGGVVLPARLLVDVVRALPAGSVELEARETERDVELRAGSARFHIHTLPAEDFPALPDPAAEPVGIPADAFAATVELVAGAASRDEARPILTGVHVSAAGSELTMAATDSYRLAVKTTELAQPVAGELEATIPARALRELTRIVGQGDDEQVEISMLGNQVVLATAGILLSSRLIEGQFPNYRQLLPETYEHEVRLSRPEVGDVVRRISLMAQKNAALRLAFSEGELTVSAQTPDIGEASETIPARFEGESLEIGFNPDFLKAGIESIEADELVLRLISPLRPGLIQAVDSEDYRYLVMPIRLNA